MSVPFSPADRVKSNNQIYCRPRPNMFWCVYVKCMNNDIVHYFMIHVVFVFSFLPPRRDTLYRLRNRVASIQGRGCCCTIGLSFVDRLFYGNRVFCEADCLMK